jgi:predicted nuclease of predicted toxin-antitoxin system
LKLLCDEGVESQIVVALRQQGHTVVYIAELDPGIRGDEVLALAVSDGMPLVTNDKDFGELVFRQGRASAGVILLSPRRIVYPTKADVVTAAIAAHSDQLSGSFTVVSRRQVRIRRQPHY